MIVCVCNNVSSKDILKYISYNKNINFEKITEDLSCCNQCECCKYAIQNIIKEASTNER